MSTTHAPSLRNELADYALGKIGSDGRLLFKSSTGKIVADLTFSNPAFDSAIDAIADAKPILRDRNANGGIISRAELCDAKGNMKEVCAVTEFGDGGDIELSYLIVEPGQTVEIDSLSYEAAP